MTESIRRRLSGKSFHKCGAFTEKPRRPKRSRLWRGTVSSDLLLPPCHPPLHQCTRSEPMSGTRDTGPCSPIARALFCNRESNTVGAYVFDRVASSTAIPGLPCRFGARSAIWRRKCHHLWLTRRVVAGVIVHFFGLSAWQHLV